MLQCRSGKRTGKGAVKIAVDMVNEGLVDTRTAIKMVEPQHIDQLLHPQVCISTGKTVKKTYVPIRVSYMSFRLIGDLFFRVTGKLTYLWSVYLRNNQITRH